MNECKLVTRKADEQVPPSGNEYFCNAEEEQNKASEWVGYIFPTPLNPYKKRKRLVERQTA